jgi:hypothetical protein
VELDLEDETTRRDLNVRHLGYARGDLRLVLAISSDTPFLVIELDGVHSFFDRGAVGCGPILASVAPEPGSFGWRLSAEERALYREFHVNVKRDPIKNIFRAIARTVVTRHAIADDAVYPG